MSIRIYVEGGAAGSKNDCRRAFRKFLEKVIPASSFQVIASGDRASTYRDFCIALKQHRQDYVILLVDSEEAVSQSAWIHLSERMGDHWRRPAGTNDDQAQLMVQVMESWFLADETNLSEFYGQGFLPNSLPRTNNIETVEKARIFQILAHVTRNTQKGEYHKTRHAFRLLERLEPATISAKSIHAELLFTSLRNLSAAL